jgi:solute carrier family 29 (equilibrative nucleoside transporter), member 1/2/3
MGMVSLESPYVHVACTSRLRSPIYRNMLMAAGPYFQGRFSSSPWILTHFQSAILSVSTVGNFGSVLLLARLQKGASYPKRIIMALLINMAAFTLMALSTSSALEARGYLGLVLAIAFFTSWATGLMQNGVFSYVGRFGRGEYTQGVMTGQAIAGVLPSVARASLRLSPAILY